MILRRLPLIVPLLCAIAPAAFGAPGAPPATLPIGNRLPVVTIQKLSAKELAGKTAEQAVWDRPLSIPRFEYYITDYLPTQQTDVRLAYDDKNLYIAYHCLEENMAKFKTSCTKRDDDVWVDDSVGIDIDIKHNHKTFYRLRSNAAGVLCDERFATWGLRQGDASWNPDWMAKGGRVEDGWTVFMTIPFRSLGVPTPRTGTVWGVNFMRRSVPEFERSCWATSRRPIQDLPAWGHFVFGGPDTPTVYIAQSEENRMAEFQPCRDRAGGNVGHADSAIAVPGKHPLTVKILNPASKPMKLRLDVLIDSKATATYHKLVAPGASDWNLNFDFPMEGLHELNFAAYDSSGKMLMRNAYQLALVPEHAARLASYRALVKAQQPKSALARSEKASIERSLDELAASIRSARGSLARWKELGGKLDEVSMQVQHLRCICADTAGRGYAVGTDSALDKIMRDEMFGGAFGKPATMSLARNEYESTQICVLAYEKPLQCVQVTVSELKGPNGAVIPQDRINNNLVEWVDCKKARYAADYYGWVPDPLMDMDRPFDVASGTLRPVWITVHAPDKIPGGLYKGTILVRPLNAPATEIPISVRVWDFTLPTTLHAKTAFTFVEGELAEWYKKPVTHEQRLQWYDFLLRYRISPTNIYSGTPQPTKEDIPFCVERGMNAFTLACTWYKTEKDLDKMEVWMRDYESYLKANGWWDMPYIYGFDELGPERFQELRDTYGGIKKRFPDLKTMTTIAPQPELKGYVDMWCPQIDNYVREIAEQYRKTGDEVWWYVSANPPHPWPNYYVDFNAASPRVFWWLSWKEHVPGILYYYTDGWECNRKLFEKDQPTNDWEKAIVAGKRWPEIKWNTNVGAYNGDGQLLYPGPNGNPIASIRMASIRDGAEDYEYFYKLNELVKQAEKKPGFNRTLLAEARKLAAIPDNIVKSTTEYTSDPAAIFNTRQQVAETIQRMLASLR